MTRPASLPRRRLLAGLGALALPLGASAQESGADKAPIRLIVGFPPGGSTDTVARLLAEKLRAPLGRQVIVDNRPGAGGRLAAEVLKNAPADGSTFLIGPNASAVFQHLLYPLAQRRYDVLTDFTPVAKLVSYPLALAVSQRTGARNVKEYLAWVRANPNEATFGSAGLGGHTHFSGLQLAAAARLPLSVVPYRGNGPLASDLLGGQIAAGVMTAGDIVQHQRQGTVRVIATFGAKRSPLLPEVPTLKEQGFDVDTGDAWTALWAPAKTPRPAYERMQAALKFALQLPEVQEQLVQRQTLQPDFRTGEEVDRLLRREIAYWGPVIQATGFKPEA